MTPRVIRVARHLATRQVKGEIGCRGYADPAATAAAFDADGWFRTGDLGVMREDGHVSLTGRLKDVIIRKGENISAKEVEDAGGGSVTPRSVPASIGSSAL